MNADVVQDVDTPRTGRLAAHGASLLTLNAGSSSIKFALFDVKTMTQRAAGIVEAIGGASRFRAKEMSGEADARRKWDAILDAPKHVDALKAIIEWIGREMEGVSIAAIGHRVVHGGMLFDQPVLLRPM